MHGRLIWFNEVKGHGYIRTEEGERLLVAAAGFVAGAPQGRCAGTQVTFDRTEPAGAEACAVGVTVTAPSEGGRARHRHHGTGTSLRRLC